MLQPSHHSLHVSHDHLLVHVGPHYAGQFTEVQWLHPYSPLLVTIRHHSNLSLLGEHPRRDRHSLDEVLGQEEHWLILNVVLQETESS